MTSARSARACSGLVGLQALVDAEGADGRQAVQLATLLRLLPMEMEPAKRFRVLAHPDQRGERDQPGGGQLPRHSRAAAAKDLGGPLAGRMRLLPAAGAIGRNARRQRDHPQRMGMPDARGQRIGGLQEPERALPAGPARRGGMERLHGERPGDPVWLARPQRQQQVAGLKDRRGKRGDQAQPGDGRPADVDARKLLRGDRGCGRRSRKPMPPGRRRSRSLERMRDRQSAAGRARQRHAHRVEHAPQDGDPLVDMAADQELHGGATLELERFGNGRPRPARRGIPAPPRHRAPRPPAHRRASSGAGGGLPDPAPILARLHFERQAVELGGAVEGQGLGRLVGPPGEIGGRALGLVGPLEVDGEGLGIGLARGEQRQREAFVAVDPRPPA